MNYSILFIGIVLFIIGAVVLWRAKKEKRTGGCPALLPEMSGLEKK